MAVHNEEQKNKSSFEKMKDFLGDEKKEKESKKPKRESHKKKTKKTRKGKESRVSALANRRRK